MRHWKLEICCKTHWLTLDRTTNSSFFEHFTEMRTPGWAKDARPCEGGCGRQVAWIRYHDPPHWFCSQACRIKADTERRARACETCGETFTPRRADARYCSSVCRQRAYRKRTGARTGAQ